jgi:putative membrane protein
MGIEVFATCESEEAAMMGWYVNGGNTSSSLGMLLMVAVWAAVIALAVWALVRFTRTEHRSAAWIEPPRAVLDRRFTSGEIDAETYAHARRVLEGEHSSSAARRS